MLATIRGTIVRRVLVNYRVRPDAIARFMPPTFRPQLVDGWSIAGICLIGLKDIRPQWLPAVVGITSENAAHRIAVEWDEAGVTKTGVYIPRRDSSSHLNQLAGGRLFPGQHHAARFQVVDTPSHIKVAFSSLDGSTGVSIAARCTQSVPESSVFADTDAASAFFRGGCTGYSARTNSDTLDGIELCCDTWNITPLDVEHVSSTYFDDTTRFAKAEATFDSAFIMRQLPHRWIGRSPKTSGTLAANIA